MKNDHENADRIISRLDILEAPAYLESLSVADTLDLVAFVLENLPILGSRGSVEVRDER